MIEVLKQALEALESCGEAHITDGGYQWHDAKLVDTAITSLRKAIQEEALRNVQRLGQEIEQEPVAWMPQSSAPKTGERFLALNIYDVVQEVEFSGLWYRDIPLWRNPHNHSNVNIKGWLPKASLHTHQATAHPPQRTWVGLTDEEMHLNCPNWLSQEQCKAWIQQIEAKLKQKNGFAEEKNT